MKSFTTYLIAQGVIIGAKFDRYYTNGKPCGANPVTIKKVTDFFVHADNGENFIKMSHHNLRWAIKAGLWRLTERAPGFPEPTKKEE